MARIVLTLALGLSLLGVMPRGIAGERRRPSDAADDLASLTEGASGTRWRLDKRQGKAREFQLHLRRGGFNKLLASLEVALDDKDVSRAVVDARFRIEDKGKERHLVIVDPTGEAKEILRLPYSLGADELEVGDVNWNFPSVGDWNLKGCWRRVKK